MLLKTYSALFAAGLLASAHVIASTRDKDKRKFALGPGPDIEAGSSIDSPWSEVLPQAAVNFEDIPPVGAYGRDGQLVPRDSQTQEKAKDKNVKPKKVGKTQENAKDLKVSPDKAAKTKAKDKEQKVKPEKADKTKPKDKSTGGEKKGKGKTSEDGKGGNSKDTKSSDAKSKNTKDKGKGKGKGKSKSIKAGLSDGSCKAVSNIEPVKGRKSSKPAARITKRVGGVGPTDNDLVDMGQTKVRGRTHFLQTHSLDTCSALAATNANGDKVLTHLSPAKFQQDYNTFRTSALTIGATQVHVYFPPADQNTDARAATEIASRYIETQLAADFSHLPEQHRGTSVRMNPHRQTGAGGVVFIGEVVITEQGTIMETQCAAPDISQTLNQEGQ